MSIDINKIIQESVQSTLDSDNYDEVTSLNESETIQEENENKNKIVQETSNAYSDPATASAISAGLGALTFRNHYRTMQEQANTNKKSSKWKTAGKIGAGLGATGAAGAAGAAGLHKLGQGEVDDDAGVVDTIKGGAKKLSNLAKERLGDNKERTKAVNIQGNRGTGL